MSRTRPVNVARVPSRSSTPPTATNAVPRPAAAAAVPSSRRASRTSPRTSSALPSARSRRRAPRPRRPSVLGSTVTGSTLPADRLAEQVAEADGHGQRAARVLLHLTLDARLQAVEIGVAQPVGRGLKAAGELVGGFAETIAVTDHGRAAAGRRGAGDLPAARALRAQLLGARLQRVGEGVLERAGAVADRGADVAQLRSRGARGALRAVGQAARIGAAVAREARVGSARVARAAGTKAGR